jgi:putative hemolysin
MRCPSSTATSRIRALGDRVLARPAHHPKYSARLATTPDEVRAAQTLRFLVFNLELKEGLPAAFNTCRDEDPFDAVCDHLLVEDTDTGEVVGTYRIQTGRTASRHLGFYSASEFELAAWSARSDAILELGRACVLREHRNLKVLALLWQGIARYARREGTRFLIGCSSLTSQDPGEGLSFYRALPASAHAPTEWQTQPRPGWTCHAETPLPPPPSTPKLLAAYLSLGARICAPPAIDRAFGTIDFLTLLDIESLPPHTAALLATPAD